MARLRGGVKTGNVVLFHFGFKWEIRQRLDEVR